MVVIGITGTLGAGKGAIVEYLVKKYGFKHYSAKDFITAEIIKRGMPVNRDVMTEVANDLRAKNSPSYIIEELYKQAEDLHTNSVIESLRAVGEVETLRREIGSKPYHKFYLFAVDANPNIRYERISTRNSEKDRGVTMEKFLSDEAREISSTDPNKQNISACINLADYVFTNNGDREDLHRQVDRVMDTLGVSKQATESA